jgi:hypothetical protein
MMKTMFLTAMIVVGMSVGQRAAGATGSYDPADSLIAAAVHGDIVALDKCLSRAANIDERNAAGSTALMAAAAAGQTRAVTLLLAKGANIEAKDDHGQTALMRAVVRGESETVALLLQHGADIEARDGEGNTALSLALVRQQRAEKHAKELSDDAYFRPMADHELADAGEVSRLLRNALARKR